MYFLRSNNSILFQQINIQSTCVSRYLKAYCQIQDLILYIFHDFKHVYSPRADIRQLPGDKILMSTETSCHFSHLMPLSNH